RGRRASRVVAERGAGPRTAAAARAARGEALASPDLLVVGASEVRGLPVSISAGGDLPPAAARAGRAAAAPRSAAAREHFSRDPGALLQKPPGRGRPAGDRRESRRRACRAG